MSILRKAFAAVNALLLCLWTSCAKKPDYDDVVNQLDAGEYRHDEAASMLPYRLYKPSGYSSAKKYPLILILHASGVQGADNRSHIGYAVARFINREIQDKTPCFILAPQCPMGSQWVNTTFEKMPFDSYDQDSIPESEAMKMVVALIDRLNREFSIDKKRLYITGSSMGGSGTWDIITRHPRLFAAALPLTGVSDPSKAHLISDMAIWAFHGSRDGVSPVTVTRRMISALQNSGSKCKFTEYEDRGHDVVEVTYNNQQVIDWLFEQSK